MSNHMEEDAARLIFKIWDLGAEDGPVQIEMRSVNARDALQRDPKRYVIKLPRGVKPGPAHHREEERKRQEMADFAEVVKRDPVFGVLGGPQS